MAARVLVPGALAASTGRVVRTKVHARRMGTEVHAPCPTSLQQSLALGDHPARGLLAACAPTEAAPQTTLGLAKLPGASKSTLSTAEPANAYKHVTTYNNFYESGTDKSDPAAYAKHLRVQPWTVVVEGEVAKPRSFGIEDLLRLPLEERVYRLRCVGAWSMVIPWIGFEFNRAAWPCRTTSSELSPPRALHRFPIGPP
jgi:DMSO/TMAO reductase YedYZ molybdopterin-dependent catalytic subunit